jgi:NADPH-dependent glutamate synthase beta subunit-like oxidoreductase/Pyruvate/2-oxoacid:ferredoxin oxidoreductase delta subunit
MSESSIRRGNMTCLPCFDPEKIVPISRSSISAFKTGSWGSRYPEHEEKVSPCRISCPAGNHIPLALFHAEKGDFDHALAAFLEESPLPGVCGRVCYHPCETDCNRNPWDGAVHIRAVERAAAEYGVAEPPVLSEAGKGYPAAVVGSGPAGLSAAYHLARMGHPVTLIEMEKELGGLLRWGIPEYRLPRAALEKDLKRILSLGIEVKAGVPLQGAALDRLRAKHAALFLATGAGASLSLDIPGMKAKGIFLGVEFLKNVRKGSLKSLPGKGVVIGGGNVAIDAAMNAQRLGSDRVAMVCLEQPEEMAAHTREIQDALEEGIEFYNGWGPKRVLEAKGKVAGVEFRKCVSVFDREGKFNPAFDESATMERDADWIILAIGRTKDLSFLKGSGSFEGHGTGELPVDGRTMGSAREGVFAGGDLIKAPGSVVEAIGFGKRAALAMHLYMLGMPFDDAERKVLMGDGPAFSIHALFHPREGWNPRKVVKFEDLEPLFLDHKPRCEHARLSPEQRKKVFVEINPSLTKDGAIFEASRCFFCGTCTGCDRCFAYCPEVSLLPPGQVGPAYQADQEYCKGCAVCAAVCPRGIMTMSEKK